MLVGIVWVGEIVMVNLKIMMKEICIIGNKGL